MMIFQPFTFCRIHPHRINFLEIFIKLFTNIQHLFQQIVPQMLF